MFYQVVVVVNFHRAELAEDFITTGEEGPKDTKQDYQENYTGANGDGY